VPVIIIYLVFNRFITKGIALGGVFRWPEVRRMLAAHPGDVG